MRPWPVSETLASIEAAIRKPGFAFVELLMPCTTAFIKTNKVGNTKDSWDWYKAHTITRSELAELDPEERAANSKTVIGTLWEAEKPEYAERWAEFVGGLE